MQDSKDSRITVRLETDLLEALQKEAALQDVPVAHLIRQYLKLCVKSTETRVTAVIPKPFSVEDFLATRN